MQDFTQKYRYEIKWTVIYVIVILLWVLGEKILGYHGKYISKYDNASILQFLPFSLIYLFFLLDKRKGFYDGSLTYLQGFGSGVVLSVFLIVVTPIVQFISTSVISPHLFENLIQYSLSQPDAGTLQQTAARFSYTSYVIGMIIQIMLTGVMWAAFYPIWLKTTDHNHNPKKQSADN